MSRAPRIRLAVCALAVGGWGCAKILGYDATLPQADGGAGQPCASDQDCESRACVASQCAAPAAFDGKTGARCASDGDCRGPAGPGRDVCDRSSPTPVCRLPQCAAPVDGQVHYCDGPDVSTSPGVCIADGTCWPKCSFQSDGSPATGCLVGVACNAAGYVVDPASGSAAGIGFCRGGCEKDADCPNGRRCQTDQGLCVSSVTPPLEAGTACDLTASPACDCFYANATRRGYCAQACTVGGAACPDGTTCDALLPTAWVQDGAAIIGFVLQNPGLGGLCAPACTPDKPPCPANSTCQSFTVAGPDCLP